MLVTTMLQNILRHRRGTVPALANPVHKNLEFFTAEVDWQSLRMLRKLAINWEKTVEETAVRNWKPGVTTHSSDQTHDEQPRRSMTHDPISNAAVPHIGKCIRDLDRISLCCEWVNEAPKRISNPARSSRLLMNVHGPGITGDDLNRPAVRVSVNFGIPSLR